MANTVKPSVDWSLRSDALTGEEHLLRQNPVGDSSSTPKEERIPTSLILSYVLSNLPSGGTVFTVTEDTSDPAASGNTPVSSFYNNTNSGEWFIIDSAGDSYSLGGSPDTSIYNSNGTINENRAVNIGDSDTLDFILGDGAVFKISQPSSSVGLTIRENLSTIELKSGSITGHFGSQGYYYQNFTLTQLLGGGFTPNSLIHKGYVDGILLEDNGGGSYTFTNASGATTSFTTGGGGTGSTITISQYSISNGSTTGEVWATGAGVTITENSGAGELTIAIPSGVDLVAVNLFMPAAVTDGGAYHIILDYAGLRSFNTAKTNLKIPLIRTGLDNYASASRANPANISENGGNSANTVTYGVSAFGGGDGSDLTMSLINFALGLNQMCRLDFQQV
jgi:hypothetical protein